MKGLCGALVVASACGHHARRPAAAPIDPSTPPLPVLYDVMVPKRTAPGGDVIGQTQCGTKMVLRERRGSSTRVTWNGEGTETFWIDDGDLARAPLAYTRCQGPLVLRDSRVSDALARSLTPPVLAESDPWETFDPELPKMIYQRDDDDTSCAEFQFGNGQLAAPSVVWGFERTGDREVRLTGPTIRDVGYLCLRDLFLARRTRDGWDLVDRSTESQGDIWAYSPSSAKRWYATRAACERGLRRGPVAKSPFRGCL